jgi:hypothetical protein
MPRRAADCRPDLLGSRMVPCVQQSMSPNGDTFALHHHPTSCMSRLVGIGQWRVTHTVLPIIRHECDLVR